MLRCRQPGTPPHVSLPLGSLSRCRHRTPQGGVTHGPSPPRVQHPRLPRPHRHRRSMRHPHQGSRPSAGHLHRPWVYLPGSPQVPTPRPGTRPPLRPVRQGRHRRRPLPHQPPRPRPPRPQPQRSRLWPRTVRLLPLQRDSATPARRMEPGGLTPTPAPQVDRWRGRKTARSYQVSPCGARPPGL